MEGVIEKLKKDKKSEDERLEEVNEAIQN